MFKIIVVWLIIFGSTAVFAADNLQNLIDKTKDGGTITLKKGVNYKGNVVIKNKTIKLYCNGAIIDAQNSGDVILLKHANNSIIDDCVIKNSGSRGWKMDCAIKIQNSKKVVIRNNKIINCLYGIVAKNSKKIKIINNDIASKNIMEGEKGDGIRLWWSSNSLVESNYIHDSRDVVSIFSNNVRFINNIAKNSHIGIMIQNSDKNLISGFKGFNNEVNIFLNCSEGSKIENFKIKNNLKYRGIVLVRASDIVMKNGLVQGCNKGLVVNLSPAKATGNNYFENITFVKNRVAIYIHTTKEQVKRNIFRNIKFKMNKIKIKNEWSK